jgi:RsiW-degrading membrane proteinase PrsW (M82 family)
MVIAGGIIWAIFTVIYAMKYKQGARARKWYGMAAYFGLALLAGGLLETFHDKLQGKSSMWIILAVVIVIYALAKVYILNNITYDE